MNKARVLLAGVMAMLALGLSYLSKESMIPEVHRYIHNGIPRTSAYVPALPVLLHFVLAILFTAGLFVLLSTFFQVHKDERGYYYDPRNVFWKLMVHFWDWDWPRQISLCRAYWLTVCFNAILTIATLGLSAFAYLVYQAFTMPHNHLSMIDLRAIGMALGTFVGLALLAVLIAKTSKFGMRFVQGMGILLAAGVVIGVPIYSMSTGPRAVPVLVAILMYLKYVAQYIGLPVAAIWAGYKYLPVLKKSAIGRFLTEQKGNFCPILEARTSRYV